MNEAKNESNDRTTVIVVKQENQSNGCGVAGFVFALLSIFLSWIPYLGWIIWFLGFLLSFIGLFKSPRGLAITGFILSVIDILVLLFIVGAVATMAL